MPRIAMTVVQWVRPAHDGTPSSRPSVTHQFDPTGEAFRYDGQLKTSASHVDVPRLVQRFRAAFGIIHSGVLTALHEHASFLREIRAEYGP
jgi:hypothetical protein